MGPHLEYDGKIIDPALFKGHDILIPCDQGSIEVSPEDIMRRGLDPYFDDNDPLSDKENIGIIINDGDRPTPSYLVLEYILERYPDMVHKISYVHIATGSHRKTPEGSLKRILGSTYTTFIDRINIHDGSASEDHIAIGLTSRGTDVRLDRRIFEHDLLIIINSVEPHYFAGFTGGRKSILPGMAWNGTIERNHSHALSPSSSPLALNGNPVNEDMIEGVNIFLDGRDHLSIQMIQGPGKILTGVEVGNLDTSFYKAVAKAALQFSIPIGMRYDIVVSFARDPMGRTLYQAQKAIENGKLALKKGGTIILVASCRDGIGNSSFWDLLTAYEDPIEVQRAIERGYKLGYHKAARIASFSIRNDIYIVSTLDDDVVSKGFMTPFPTVEDALRVAIERSGGECKVLVIPDGTMTVPKPPE